MRANGERETENGKREAENRKREAQMRANGERETENAKNEAQMKVNGERETENGNVLLGHRNLYSALETEDASRFRKRGGRGDTIIQTLR